MFTITVEDQVLYERVIALIATFPNVGINHRNDRRCSITVRQMPNDLRATLLTLGAAISGCVKFGPEAARSGLLDVLIPLSATTVSVDEVAGLIRVYLTEDTLENRSGAQQLVQARFPGWIIEMITDRPCAAYSAP